MNIITLTLQLPEGYRLPDAGRTEVSVRNTAGVQISASGGQGSNMAPKEPVNQPWQYRFQVDPETMPAGEQLLVKAQAYQDDTALFLDTEQAFTWDGGDQHVDIPLSLAPASLVETVQAPTFGS
ncbi:hypothetical protein ACNT2N_10270 [Pseudomonas thivervalensis]|uniref:Uncharacterized protein n=1 Tax=Pseudomonas thivervalensis TaxID=86265 RepID=A0A176NIK9_9PSED|nr:hypothetical protein [Pseudomonas thivervalensis]AXA55475.1 hypothetical protein CE140_14250 [Pseudomonas thivervalensis]AXA61293.1 hypothetical protein CEQ51_14805 [Pseudomonas thivervalensis]OAB50974.1 hypothetical protein APS14_04710 [Pseudomonas thivervalensis]SDG06801.1 hypothetical protein SAMN04490204_2900 [Pseudomonas thivervalensis]